MSMDILQSESKYSEKDTEWLKYKLGEVHWDIKRELIDVLETDRNQWKDLVAALPKRLTKSRIRMDQLTYFSSPTWALMQKLEQWNFTVEEMIDCLERVKLYNALLVIKPDVELEIMEDLKESMNVEAGNEVRLRCRATGFPLPQYQWYKDDEELLSQISDTLTLEDTSLSDSGVYYCRVYTIDRFTKEERPNPLLSNYCEVQIYQPPPRPPVDPSPQGTLPVILVQPVSPGENLPHGFSCALKCSATGQPPLSYQWFKDDQALPGETEKELLLSKLFPDEIGRKHSWQYQCLVQDRFGQVFTDKVTVGLFKEEPVFTATDKWALLIGNENYHHMESFILPSSDVATLSKILSRQGFKVMAYVDLTLAEMYNAVHLFCSNLQNGAYGFVYFAGHGFEFRGQSYMQPVDASNNCLTKENLSLDYLEARMQECQPAISMCFMDMCREQPPDDSLRQLASQHCDTMPRNVLRFYATSFLGEAFEVSGLQNSLFVQHLKSHMEMRKSIRDVTWDVQQDMNRDYWVQFTGQIPCLSSNIFEARSLWDPIHPSSTQKSVSDNKWTLSECPVSHVFHLGIFRFEIAFTPHKGVFCNALDMRVQVSPWQGLLMTSLAFPPDISAQCSGRSKDGCRMYTLKGLQKLKEPLLYRVTLNTGREEPSQVSFVINLP